MSNEGITYKDAGVDIEAGDAAVERIATAAARTHGTGVLGGLGGFGALFSLKDALGALDDPLLVSGTDGVGTKLLVAIGAGRHDTVGQDLVAMCVNDILTVGARPLFFLDYFATAQLDPEQMATVVTGIASACESIGCALIGGETAEMPGLYVKGDYDLAGFCVGAVERSRVVDGSGMQAGDAIIGLSSSGLHSNGFSLAREVILKKMGKGPNDALLGELTVADALLVPTKLYVNPVLALLGQDVAVRAMAHITGGGLPGNLVRGFPEGLGAVIDSAAWEEPPIFKLLRENGPIAEDEMRRAFNLGIGYCMVVPDDDADGVIGQLLEDGVGAQVIGEVVKGERAVRYVGDEDAA
jgi:phosphoribosylformylglycinamidine cyclo-ligase